ncbi:MAG: hypothetical protein AABZ57_08225 [Candidatus Margulisiibacteriota bacterium]
MTENINKIPDNMIKEVNNMNKNKTIERSMKDLRDVASKDLSDQFNKIGASVPKEAQNKLVDLVMRAYFMKRN